MPVVIDGSVGISQAEEFDSNSTFGFKNRIINGDMRIDQRNAGASVTITTLNGQYTLDRWNVNTNQASKVSVQQSTTTPTGFTNSALITSLSAFSPAAGDYFGWVQYVEGFNAADFQWGTANAQTVNVSFVVRASITGTYAVAFGNSAQARSYVATFTVNAANTFETKTITIPGDTSGTWLTNNGIGLRMWFDLGSGSTFNQASPNTWTASNTLRTSGSVTLVGTNGATFYLTGVQLEKGSTATSFEQVEYGEMLRRCQRYYFKTPTGTAYTYYSVVAAESATAASSAFIFPQIMRAAPTGNSSGTFMLNGNVTPNVTSFSFSQVTTWCTRLTANVASGLTTSYAYAVRNNNDSAAFLDFSAEL